MQRQTCRYIATHFEYSDWWDIEEKVQTKTYLVEKPGFILAVKILA